MSIFHKATVLLIIFLIAFSNAESIILTGSESNGTVNDGPSVVDQGSADGNETLLDNSTLALISQTVDEVLTTPPANPATPATSESSSAQDSQPAPAQSSTTPADSSAPSADSEPST